MAGGLTFFILTRKREKGREIQLSRKERKEGGCAASFKSHAELRRRGELENEFARVANHPNNKTPRLRIFA